MECPACHAPIGPGARFCTECGAAVPTGCAACGAANPPGAKFCSGCGVSLAPSASPAPTAPAPMPERRQLSVMFCDLVGSTELSSRLDPEDLGSLIRAYQARAAEAIAGFDGFIAKYMGDGILVYFGWPKAGETDAEQAVRTALAVTEAVSAAPIQGEALRVRVGIATGLVVVGDRIGTGEAREQTAIGETPNRAARLQAEAGPGGIIIDAATQRQLGNLFEMHGLGALALKGLPEPVAAFEVRAERASQSRFEALHAARLSPLIGREEELEFLQRRWAQVKDGQGRVVLISGEPGIGKSRLLAALQESLKGDHVTLRFSCSPHHQASVLSPVIHQLRRAARLAPSDAPADLRRKLQSVLPESAIADEDLDLIAGLLAGAEITAAAPDLSPQRRKEKTAEALLRVIAAHARTRPVLVIVEDAHWADPSTRDLLDLAIERLRETSWLLAVTSRPDFSAPWLGRSGVALVALSRLSLAQAAELAREVAGERELSGSLCEHIVARADGVPLFVEELTEALLDQASDSASPVAHNDIPSTLRASLVARLDRLPRAKDLLQLGAVIGRSFAHDLLADLSGQPVPKLSGALNQIVASGLVSRRGTPPNAMYTFKHALVQEAAYDTLLRPRRVELHGRIARLLEDRFPETVEREPEMLARHAALAGEAERAAQLLLRAAENAMRGYALSEAEAHLTAGLALIPGLPNSERRQALELDLQTALGQAMMGRRGFADPATGLVFDRARALASGKVPLEKLVSVLHGNFMYHLVGGRLVLALDAAEQIGRAAERSRSPPLLFAARLLLGMPSFHMGDFPAALEHWRTLPTGGAGDGEVVGLRFVSDFRAMLEANRSWALLVTGDVAAADRSDQAAWTAAETSRATFSNAGVFCFSCCFSLLRGNRDAVRRKIGPTLAYCQEQRYSYWLAIATLLRACCMAEDDGASNASMGLYRRGMEAYRATGSSLMIAFALGMQADVLRKNGRVSEALPLVTEAFHLARIHQDRWFEAELHRVEGDIWRAKSDTASADASFQRAIGIARNQSAKLFELRASVSLARLWVEHGRRDEAHALLAPIHAWFTEGFDTPDLTDAKALLDELTVATA